MLHDMTKGSQQYAALYLSLDTACTRALSHLLRSLVRVTGLSIAAASAHRTSRACRGMLSC